LARLSGRLLCRRWRGRRSLLCDMRSSVPWNVPLGPSLERFLELGPVIEMIRRAQRLAKPRVGIVSIGSNGAKWKDASSYLRDCELVRQMLAVFGSIALDSDGGDRDSRLHSAQCVAGSGARVARSGTACRAPTEETATAKRTMWRCVASIANRAVALRWRRLKPTLLKGNGTIGRFPHFLNFHSEKSFRWS
jgi:hypothetical protein